MPEIAEVRVVANTLKKNLIGRKIKKIRVLYPRIIDGNVKEFTEILEGNIFKDITTCGKWIIFDLGGYSILSHLRMEGKYFYVPSSSEVEKHTHVVFELDDGMDLRYNDVRKFGRMAVVLTDKVQMASSIQKLGIEPDDDRLTWQYLLEAFSKKSQPIKTSLLDQSIINGLGNIYANEVLFASKISPFRKTNTITKSEAEAIVDNSRKIVLKSVEAGGCTIRSYTSSLGVIGHYQDYLEVHGKNGQRCSRCGEIILKEKLDGRSAYYCPKCQK